MELRDEIKEYQEQLQKAVIVKQNKIKFNQNGMELTKFDKTAVIDDKLQTVRDEIKESNEKYAQ